MPIEIKELMIEVKVSDTSSHGNTTANTVPQNEVIAACIDQVMTVINTSKER